MKYYLVDNYTECIIDVVELASNVGLSGARTFFIGRKVMKDNEEAFDKIWRTITEKEYETQKDLGNRQNKQYDWWNDEERYLDIDAPMTESKNK
jgi:hypothetical protein